MGSSSELGCSRLQSRGRSCSHTPGGSRTRRTCGRSCLRRGTHHAGVAAHRLALSALAARDGREIAKQHRCEQWPSMSPSVMVLSPSSSGESRAGGSMARGSLPYGSTGTMPASSAQLIPCPPSASREAAWHHPRCALPGLDSSVAG
jgi:hypothetical protein